MNLFRNLVLAVTAMRRERPCVVVSAGVAVPFFVVTWLMRVPTGFIEVFDRIDSPTMTGRPCGRFSCRIVQWKSQQEFYPQRPAASPREVLT